MAVRRPSVRALGPGVPVVAETYPAALYHQLNIRPVKRQPSSRAAASTALLDWARDNHVDVDTLRPDRVRGFETDDDFDAVIGLLGMINVVRGRQAEGRPASNEMLAIEGWMLGLAEVVS